MLRNFLNIALRNMWKNKFFSSINIAGFAVGIATCMLITLYVLDELNFDRFNENADRIYRIDTDIKFGGAEQKFAVASDPIGSTMVRDYPEVENAVRFRSYGSSVVKKGNQNIKEQRIIFADSSLFDVFTLPMIAGNPKKALVAPNQVVITERIASKYFGDSEALGKVLHFDNNTDYTISGVIKDPPANSHLRFDFFISMVSSKESQQNNWVSFNFNTYLLLRKNADAAVLESKFDNLLDKYVFPQAKEIIHISKEDFLKSGNYIRLSLMPLTKIHLFSDRIAELSPNSDIQFVYIFSAIAVFILLIACVNFMNLSTARSANRAREVGVRKVLGTRRLNLLQQFFFESVLMSLFSVLLAVAIASLLLPLFNELSSKELTLSPYKHPLLPPILVAFSIVTGLLAGSYPAFYLSAFKPIHVLKGRLGEGFKSSYFRSSMVVFQFFISIFLIIGTIVIYRQLDYIQHKKLGFNKEQVLTVKDTYVLKGKLQSFKNELLEQPGIVSATISGFLPVPSGRSDNVFFPEGEVNSKKAVSMQNWNVDEDYLKTLGMELLQGRDFSKQFGTDSSSTIINESAARLFGFSNPVGKTITTLQDINNPGSLKHYTIIGVVKNFHFESLRQNIGALCLLLKRSSYAVSFRIKAGSASEVIRNIENEWKKMAPGEAFSYSFLNDDFNSMYHSEQKVGKICIAFAILAVFIACLGLLGLATYAAEQRTKEIGIRKVLGASIGNIAGMLSKDFVKLVVIAAVITFPVAWWAMHRWLQDFAFRITINWWIFLVAGLIALFIALLTVSFQSIKAALSNPIKSLRTE